MSDSQIPAHALWVELSTRITTQSLHQRSGDEETAATSVAKLFQTTRELLTLHPGATEFQRLAEALLNHTLRPTTARCAELSGVGSEKSFQECVPFLEMPPV